MSIDKKVYIVWYRFGFVDITFMSVWNEKHLADKEATSLNERDPEAFYYVTEETLNPTLQ